MADLPPHAQLGQMISGYWISQAIYAAAKLGIADLLNSGPRSSEDLARATGTKADLLYRLLRALASVGIFAEDQAGRFSLTPMAELLGSDVRGSQRPLALMMGDEQFRAWGNLVDTLQSGDNAFEKVFEMPIFDYLAQHPDKGRIFDAAMTSIHGRETAAIADSYDFSDFKALADVGGGNGSQITAILQRYPAIQGILFDLPHVLQRARPGIEAAGLAQRCKLVSGSFFQAVPAGADAYLMRHIIHDWDDEKSRAILRACHAAMPEHGKLLVVESVIPPGNEPFGGKFLDLVMMLIPGGKERTEAEYRQLYDSAGFDLSRIVPTSTEVSVIEGVKTSRGKV